MWRNFLKQFIAELLILLYVRTYLIVDCPFHFRTHCPFLVVEDGYSALRGVRTEHLVRHVQLLAHPDSQVMSKVLYDKWNEIKGRWGREREGKIKGEEGEGERDKERESKNGRVRWEKGDKREIERARMGESERKIEIQRLKGRKDMRESKL